LRYINTFTYLIIYLRLVTMTDRAFSIAGSRLWNVTSAPILVLL